MKTNVKRKENKEKTNMKCVFCNSYLSNITVDSIFSSSGCDTCGYGSYTEGRIVIKCDKCDKVIYIKEFRNE